MVLDAGDGVTHAVPVYEGFAMSHAIRRVDVAGRYRGEAGASALVVRPGSGPDAPALVQPTWCGHWRARCPSDVTRHLQTLLRKAGCSLTSSAELEVVREIKERLCYVAPNVVKEARETAGRTEEYVLPDGVKVQVRRRAPVPVAPHPLPMTALTAGSGRGGERARCGPYTPHSLVLSGFKRPSSSLTQRSSATSRPASTRWWTMRSAKPTLTCARPCTATSSCPAARPCSEVSLALMPACAPLALVGL